MNFGSGNIGYEIPSSGPGSSGARNGLSNSGGFNVLGQDVGQAGNPAALLNDREIPANAFYTAWLRNDANNSYVRVGVFPGNPGIMGVHILGFQPTMRPLISLRDTSTGAPNLYVMEVAANQFQVSDNTGLLMIMQRNVLFSVTAPAQFFQLVIDTAVNLNISLPLNRSRAVYTNRGAVAVITIGLPVIGVSSGPEYTFVVVAAFQLTILAPAGVTIRIGNVVSPAGGSVSALAVGSSVRLQSISINEWVAIAVVGVWVTP